MALNILAFLADVLATHSNLATPGAAAFFSDLALHPDALRWWQPITYQFMHAGLLHIGGNMLFLYVFGGNVEDRMGRLWFLLFYLASGVLAALVQMLMSDATVVGASGAISGVTGAYMVLFPKTMIRVFVLFFLIGVFQIPAIWFIGAAIAWDLFFPRDSVATAAHLGGYLFGSSTALVLLWTRILPRETYDLFTMLRQANRRRKFRELTSQGRTGWAGDASRVREPDGAGKPKKPARSDAASEDLSRRRIEISALRSAGDLRGAAAAYRSLLDAHGRVCLAPDAQLAIAGQFYADGDFSAADVAYSVFLDRRPTGREAAEVRVLLALINARRLNDPVRAKAMLASVREAPLSGDQRALVDTLIAELG